MENKDITTAVVESAMHQVEQQQKGLPENPFKSVDEVVAYVQEHLNQKTKEEGRRILGMEPDEAYGHGMMEGIISALMLVGYDVEAMEGMGPAVDKDTMDAVIRGDRREVKVVE